MEGEVPLENLQKPTFEIKAIIQRGGLYLISIT